MLTIDTKNVLFIVSGAFAGLEDIVGSRAGRKGIGFNGPLQSLLTEKHTHANVMPQDLVKFGLIPEFIGRLPIIATVEELDRAALIQILTGPRNALAKQYEKMLRLDGIELIFEPEAMNAIADLALSRGTGARGLRAIMEETLQPIMFDLPGREDIARAVITADVVLNKAEPILVTHDEVTGLRGKTA